MVLLGDNQINFQHTSILLINGTYENYIKLHTSKVPILKIRSPRLCIQLQRFVNKSHAASMSGLQTEALTLHSKHNSTNTRLNTYKTVIARIQLMQTTRANINIARRSAA